ncbi:hypothetical protein [Ferroacidibacillus organovorans]|uniref:Uncharacterized protein n=1 Tax=Ferroacidibacillus organovorans TaxID=1765683 RepID=A0A853KCM3_9BACL|nr:hypothetical protein [Ferroacidibacillus organovorans]KYP79905.1 hypothetical protein AYJ22_03120 [Ferroacidibacillus organovorans]OAG94617.1 hypothetical protein AYW79_04495 [Ferroacidibacillus organovorans]
MLVLGFWNGSGPTLVDLPAMSRFSLYLIITIVTTLSSTWSRAYHYLFVRQEAKLLRQFRVPTFTLIMSFTLVTVLEGLFSSLAYTITFSFSNIHPLFLFILLFVVRIVAVTCTTWFVMFAITYIRQFRVLFVICEMVFKSVSGLVTFGFALILLLRHDQFLMLIMGALDSRWILFGLLICVITPGIFAIFHMQSRRFTRRFTAMRKTGVLRRARGHTRRMRWIPANQTLALVMKDIYDQITLGYLLRLATFTGILIILRIALVAGPIVPVPRIYVLSMLLLFPSHIAWFNLWLTIIFFLEPCSTVFQDEVSVRRLYWLFHIPIRKVMLSKWILIIGMALVPLLVGLTINREWSLSATSVWNVVLSIIILVQVLTCVVLVSSVSLVSARGTLVNKTELQQVPQVPSATIALAWGFIDTFAVSFFDRVIHVYLSIEINLLLVVILIAFLLSYWPKLLKSWYRAHGI